MKLLPFALGLALALPAAAQSTINVPQDQPTIQAAIAVAVNGDTVLVAPGVYNEQIDFLGKAITVRSSGGADVTTIDSLGATAWLDFPDGAVVRMINGEGPASVLEGFTVTGANGPASPGDCGIWCDGLSPTIKDCIVRDNNGGLGAGIAGNALIENCEIKDNSSMPYGDGGGLRGQPTVIDSVISGNRSGGLGGGIYATGPCLITGTLIFANIAGNGADGYSGGGVFGPATLDRCEISRNSAHHWFSGGPPDTIGTAVDGAVAMTHCTVSENFIEGGAVPGEPSGALKNVGTAKNCIFWNNEAAEVAVGSATAVSYSIVAGGYPGMGVLSSDPLFTDPAINDFTLQPLSPAIDAGDPTSPLDPDGTRADMGAYFFPKFPATFTVHNGSGANPVSYATAVNPVIGTTWTATVDMTLHAPTANFAGAVGVLLPGAVLPTAFGELLLNPLANPVVQVFLAPVGSTTTIQVAIPSDPALFGVTVYTQGLAGGPGLVELANAIDLFLGS